MFVYTLFSFLPFMVTLFWTVVIVLENIHGWKKGFMPKLLLLSSVCTVFYLGQAYLYLVPDSGEDIMEIIVGICRLSVYPLFFLFIKKITTTRDADFYDFLLMLPVLAMLVCAIVFKMTGSVHTELFCWVNPVYFLVMLYLSFKSSICIIRYNRQIRNFYSNTSSKTFGMMLLIMILLLCTSFLSILKSFIGRDFFNGEVWVAIPSLLVSIIVFMIFYESIHIDFSAEDAASDQLDVNQILQYWKRRSLFVKNEIKEEKVQATVDTDLLRELELHIRENKMYRNPELKITDLTDYVASNRTYVSNAINQGFNMSFSDYINKLRVEDAMSMLAEADDVIPLKQVAEKVGFNNEASFYRNFRKITGMTPTEWTSKNRINR